MPLAASDINCRSTAGYASRAPSFPVVAHVLPTYRDRSCQLNCIGTGLFCANISTIHLLGLASSGYRDGLVIGNFEWMAAVLFVLMGVLYAILHFALASEQPDSEEAGGQPTGTRKNQKKG